MLFKLIFLYLLIISLVEGSHKYNERLGVCAQKNQQLTNDIEPSKTAYLFDVVSNGYHHLSAEKKQRLVSMVQEVKRFLFSNNIQLSDLSLAQIDCLARRIAELYLQKEKERTIKKLLLEAYFNEAGREDLARLVATDHFVELEKKLISNVGGASSIEISSSNKETTNRRMESFQSETPSRKPASMTSSPREAATVGGLHDNDSGLIKPIPDQFDIDAEQPDSFQVQSRSKEDFMESDKSSPENQLDDPKSNAFKQQPGSSKSTGKFAKKTKSGSSNKEATYIIVIVVLVVVVFCIVAIALVLYCMKSAEARNKLLGVSSNQSGDDYQALCRQLYASKASEKTETKQPLIQQTSSKRLFSPSLHHSKTSRNSSQSSWSEEPITTTLDISTGHTVLAYMEDHLNNKDRLDREWKELCSYKADSVTTKAAEENPSRNRCHTSVPYDYNRVKLRAVSKPAESDYINASFIIDNDPRSPVYIATQGPLPSTVRHFWQMVWEQGSVVIVMLTPLMEEGVSQCARYWPDEGSSTYDDYEIHLVSEHIWCDDYLVRSLYLKNLKSGETRTVTQFHFFSWPVDGVPTSSKQLLELRRKVSKCYRGNALSPIVVHCSDGCGRTGSYMLLDMVISRMVKGNSKEIDMAATLEHLRDQRAGPIVSNKKQLEFALACVADEVNAILKVLLQ